MSRILVCQHVPYEILGTLDPLLRDAGARIRYINFGRDPHAKPSLDGYDALIILGGPMSVDEVEAYPHLPTEQRMIREAVQRNIPTLGICLGAQLIATALGAHVGRNTEKEIGWYRLKRTEEGRNDPLLKLFRDEETIYQWHGDTFAIPEGAVHLASSPTCENQAFRYGDSAYGFQFHLEVDEPLIRRWLQVPGHVEEIAALNGKIDPDRIREETPQRIERSLDLSRAVFTEFIDRFGLRKTSRALPSR